MLSIHQFFEAPDGVRHWDVLTRRTSELLSHTKRLLQKTLDFARPGHNDFVFFRQFVDT